MIATLVWFGQNCKVAQTFNSKAQGVPIQFYISFLEQFFLLEPVGGSAPKFSSGAIEQLKIKSSTAAALLCAAQAAPSPGFRSGGCFFLVIDSPLHFQTSLSFLGVRLGRLLPIVYLHKMSPQLEFAAEQPCDGHCGRNQVSWQ